MEIEELVKKLVFLAKKPTLSKGEHDEAKKLMIELKKAGMSNSEISKLSGAKWSVPTVKGYTVGVASLKPDPWQDAVSLLNTLISENISLDSVGKSLKVIEHLKANDLELDDVVDFFGTADSASIDVTSVMQWVKELEESGLSLNNVKEAIELKKELQTKGLALDALQALVKLASNYGNAQQVLGAVSAYGSLNELSAEIHAAEDQLKKLGVQINSADGKLKETQAKNADLANPLKAYQEAVELGFGEKELNDLTSLASKFGGPKAVLSGIKSYTDEAQIEGEVAKAKLELSNLQSEINKVSAKYAHLTTAIAMCQSLMNKYNLGLDAIATIHSLAKKHGEPMNVLKAIEAYGSLQSMQQEMAILAGQISESNNSLAQLEGKNKAALDQFESLNATALKVGAEVSNVENQLAASKVYQKLLTLMNKPESVDYKEYGPLVASIAVSIRKFVANNENKFAPFTVYNIKPDLDRLISELGGS